MSDEAHAIDIEECVECPFVGKPAATDQVAQCTHPLRKLEENCEVALHAAPPATCPHRFVMTVLRVTAPMPTRSVRRKHLRSLH